MKWGKVGWLIWMGEGFYDVELGYDTRGSLNYKRVVRYDDDDEKEIFETFYTHGGDGMLASVEYPDSSREEYLFLEGLLLRVRYTDEDGEVKERYFVYDDMQGLEHVLLEIEVEDGEVEKVRRYVLGEGIDEILWVEVFEWDDGEIEKEKVRYYHQDHLGSVMLITNEKGKRSAEYEYSPYGLVLVARGDWAKKNYYTFTGRMYMPHLGMYWLRARMYDPRVGRFVERDNIDLTIYNYVANNPISNSDPSGLAYRIRLTLWFYKFLNYIKRAFYRNLFLAKVYGMNVKLVRRSPYIIYRTSNVRCYEECELICCIIEKPPEEPPPIPTIIKRKYGNKLIIRSIRNVNPQTYINTSKSLYRFTKYKTYSPILNIDYKHKLGYYFSFKSFVFYNYNLFSSSSSGCIEDCKIVCGDPGYTHRILRW